MICLSTPPPRTRPGPTRTLHGTIRVLLHTFSIFILPCPHFCVLLYLGELLPLPKALHRPVNDKK